MQFLIEPELYSTISDSAVFFINFFKVIKWLLTTKVERSVKDLFKAQSNAIINCIKIVLDYLWLENHLIILLIIYVRWKLSNKLFIVYKC